MINIIIEHPAKACSERKRLPDENGKPSNNVTDPYWRKTAAMDEDINFYDIYWAPGADIREHPTAIICNGKDVTKDVTVIW